MKIVFPDHRGLATWGARTVPREQFVEAAQRAGSVLDGAERESAIARFVRPHSAPEPVEGPYERVVVFGGVYSNHLALAALLERSAAHGAQAIYCLGDLGGFGPNPEKSFPLLAQGGVRTIQGNYEQSLAGGADDCNCGYTDPRDNHFAELSYRYTAERCSAGSRHFMGQLPRRRRIRVGETELLLAHGSPRRVNEFLFDSTTSSAFLEVLLDQFRCDAFCCTHTGLPWQRSLDSGRQAVNVGVIGRPANDGKTTVRYALLSAAPSGLSVELRELDYDHESLAVEMRAEALPEEFVETILTGWWTTCLEILPAKERAGSRY